jgi:hypothetical protein
MMFNLRQANLQDLEVLIQLRLELLREASDIKGDSDTANLAEATRKYLSEKMPSGKFLAWVAEVDSQIVATSGLVFFQRPLITQYSSDKTKTLVETAIYRVSKTQNFCQWPLTEAYCLTTAPFEGIKIHAKFV